MEGFEGFNLSGQDAFWETEDGFNVSIPEFIFSFKESKFVSIVSQLDLHLVPAICGIGIVGNALSFMVLVCTYLRRTSASIYLAALSLADLCFLVGVLLSWGPLVQINLYHQTGWCQFTVFLKYVSYFLSVWYIVSFTAERYIAVHFPLRRNQLCTSKRAKIVVVSLAVLGCLLYSLALWSYTVKAVHPGISLCAPRDGYTHLVSYLHNINTVITLIIPFALIAVMNVRIAHKVLKFYHQRKSMTMNGRLNTVHSKKSSSSGGSGASGSNQPRRSGHVPHSGHGSHQGQHCGSQPRSQLRVTKMLLVISTAFLVMHMPRHAARVYSFIQEMRHSSYSPTLNFILWSKVFTYLYYLNFALNLFLYSVCGRSFRKAAIWLKNKIVHRVRDRVNRTMFRRASNNPRYGNGSNATRVHLVVGMEDRRGGGVGVGAGGGTRGAGGGVKDPNLTNLL